MSSESTANLLNIALTAASLPALGLLTSFQEATAISGGVFTFTGANGNSNGTAYVNTFNFSMPAGTTVQAYGYVPGTSLSGTLQPAVAIPEVVNVTMTPSNGTSSTIGTLPANSTNSVTISWTGSGGGGGFTESEARAYLESRGALLL
ncbi:MAG: hypothetical protein JO197_14875 [Acidobacteria bacterium]|nr:hypothetical protein [Acidobacteriota bacterium]MBV9478830.1 hypothetical protein [Acidobacteriota bacterium]